MTLEDFKKKYTWAERMTPQDVKGLLMHLMMMHLKMAMDRKGGDLEEFFDDCKEAVLGKD